MVEKNININEARDKVIKQDYDALNKIMEGIGKSESYRTQIDVDNNGKVVGLYFADKELTNISPEIAKLNGLEKLFIGWTKDLTSIPEEIKYLDNLKKLNIEWNMDLIALPKTIGELSSLEELSISENPHLSEITNHITNLQNLKNLEMNGNNLTEIPIDIGKLENLEYLMASNSQSCSLPYDCKSGTNKISFLPESIGNLKKLKQLNVMSNALRRFPESIGDLESLEYLQAGKNNISSFPKSFFNLKNLESLNIFSNSFSSLPKEIFSLDNLSHLSAHYNRIRNLPRSILNSNLTSLDLNGNPLNNTALKKLEYLRDEGIEISTADTDINHWKEKASSKIISTLSEISRPIKPRMYFNNSSGTREDIDKKMRGFTKGLSMQDIYLAMRYSEDKSKNFSLFFEKPTWNYIANELREFYEYRIDLEEERKK